MNHIPLQQQFQDLRKIVMKELHFQNIHQVPQIQKIVINVGVGEAVTNKKVIDSVREQISLIAGQRAVITKARKSVSAFKIRKGIPIGVKVTLRSKLMYAFLEKLIRIVLPRIRDFRGLSDSCIDANGNVNIGLSEQTLFPEIEYDTIDRIRGLEITIVCSGRNKEATKQLMTKLGIPFVS